MGDSTDVVLQYYTIVSEDQKEVYVNKYDQDNSVLYLVNSELQNGNILKIEDDNQVDEPSTSFESNVKLITLEDGRMFITTAEEEHFDTIQPHLLNIDYEEDEAPENDEEITNFETEEAAIDSDSKYHLLQFSDNPKMMKMIYYKTADTEAETDEVEEEEEKEVRFKCFYEGCEKTYTTSYHLTVHMRSHVNDKPYSCTAEGCSKKFSTNYSLKAHIRTHTGEKPYGCIHCAKHFKTSGDLHKHIRIHTGIKPFTCPIDGCGKSFTTSNIRKVHIRSHTGERPYLCKHPNCGKAFSSSTNYKNHIRIHSGEKPYVCSVEGCDKRFTEYSSLYKHNTVHQQQRPHECSSCGQKFKQKSSLNLHKVFKHKAVMCNDGTEIIIS